VSCVTPSNPNKKKAKKKGKTRFELETAGSPVVVIRPPVTLVTV